jgi:hypothetical protein
LGVAAAVAACALLALGTAYYLTHEPAPEIRVLWRSGITAERRAELERRFLLVNRAPYEDRFTYDLLDTRLENIKALVNERDAADTDGVGRVFYTLPVDFPYGQSWMWIAHRLPVLRIPGVVEGTVGVCALVVAAWVVMSGVGWTLWHRLFRGSPAPHRARG